MMDSLGKHRKLALDLDGTLIDGAASATLTNYVKNHPDKTFSIVTFRAPQQSVTIPEELLDNGLSVAMFQRIISMPQRLVMDFEEDQQMRRNASLPRLETIGQDELLPGEFKFMHWKGYITNKLGATALVDDMPFFVALGCKKFGVALIDVATIPLTESRRFPCGEYRELFGRRDGSRYNLCSCTI
jgi:hypothetical protein